MQNHVINPVTFNPNVSRPTLAVATNEAPFTTMTQVPLLALLAPAGPLPDYPTPGLPQALLQVLKKEPHASS